MPLNTLVGSWKGSVGLCTNGQILDAGRWSSTDSTRLSSYGHDCTVGVLMYIDDDSEFMTWDGEMVNAKVAFSVNGNVVRSLETLNPLSQRGGTEAQQHPWSGALTLAIPKEEELFPTVTLHSANTQVLGRFCEQDILAERREDIGAVGIGEMFGKDDEDVVVYCLDGSVLFDKVEENGEEEEKERMM